MVDEYEIQPAVGEAVLRAQPAKRRPTITEMADDDRHAIADTRVIPDPVGNLGVRRAELDRVELSGARHDSGHPQRAVTAVGTQLKETPGLHAPDRPVEDLTLLVSDIHHEAAAVAEVVDHADHVVDVTSPGVPQHVVGERFLASVAHLPVRHHTLPAKHEAQHGPPQERHRLAAELVRGDRRSE